MKVFMISSVTSALGPVLTGLEPLALIYLDLAVHALVSRVAHARVLGYPVNTRGSILTRVTRTFINIRFTILP